MIRTCLRKMLLHQVNKSFSQCKRFENNFLTTTNLSFIESLFQKWQNDPQSVSPSFQTYFQLLNKGQDPQSAYQKVPSLGEPIQEQISNEISHQLKIRMMIQRYRGIAHQFSQVDPLHQSRESFIGAVSRKVLQPQSFGFKPQQISKQFPFKSIRTGSYLNASPQKAKQYLQGVYCKSVGYEYMHLLDKTQRNYIKEAIQQNIQSLEVKEPTHQQYLKCYDRICKDQTFIDFLSAKFGNFKRFGLEGLNSATAGLEELVEQAANLGVKNVVMGMAHRGRLNTLHCVYGKPAQTIFQQFLQKTHKNDEQEILGDVKYHLGYTNTKKYGNNQITLSILPNPSHLEAVNPLVYGSVRAIQEYHKRQPNKTLGVLIHGDAAMCGQGVVYQSSQMHDLHHYGTGGIIHIVMNNQIGFTTNPSQARSSFYCTQIAKVIGVPIFHVNGDDPVLLDRCMRIAMGYRQRFNKDIFIDIVGYRRYGHNEQDQPFFTQPLMYERIKNKKTVYDKLVLKLLEKGQMTKEQIEERRKNYYKNYEKIYEKVINDQYENVPLVQPEIHKISQKINKKTGVKKQTLETLFNTITTWPQDFNIHPTIKKIYQQRRNNFQNNQNLDWATMESLAFATLLHEGYGIRLSGQDVERGTFSHRHAYISDQKRDVHKFSFLQKISPKITICNSHLSQYGVLGFEFGYSVTNPNYLNIWQAQFGDFANGASIIIDNFIAGSETKWNQQSGIVLSLPHGMDGQGPEHSSARMQRFLQLSDDNCDLEQQIDYEYQLEHGNIQIVCCSTSANFFHILRRQMHKNYRKPLILFNSKKLLKFKGANRLLRQIIEDTSFQPVYPDQEMNPSEVKKILLCNGQFYYQLKGKRDELKRKDVAIIRVQQLAPFPHEHLKKALSGYKPGIEICWVQEEHQNYGAWNFIYPRLKKLSGKSITFHGRHSSGSPAVGMLRLHKKQQKQLLNEIFS